VPRRNTRAQTRATDVNRHHRPIAGSRRVRFVVADAIFQLPGVVNCAAKLLNLRVILALLTGRALAFWIAVFRFGLITGRCQTLWRTPRRSVQFNVAALSSIARPANSIERYTLGAIKRPLTFVVFT
jgi:hypothetical protein